MVAKQTKDSKEREEEKDRKIADLLMAPIEGAEDLNKIIKEKNTALAKQQDQIEANEKEIADLNAISVTAGTGIVKQLQADNDRLKKEKEDKDQELREKTAILQNMASQGNEET